MGPIGADRSARRSVRPVNSMPASHPANGNLASGNEPTVTVRYWAGAKAAAGVAEETVVASTLAAVLNLVQQNRDAAFARVLAACSFVVSETPVGAASPDSVKLSDGDVVEVLPPFAGGAR